MGVQELRRRDRKLPKADPYVVLGAQYSLEGQLRGKKC